MCVWEIASEKIWNGTDTALYNIVEWKMDM